VRTVGKVLRKLGFSRMSPRPQHPQSDEAAQEEYKKSLPLGSQRRSFNKALAGTSRFGGRMKPASANKAR
jgi:hypothetical protein